jgi:hypothetical protein
MTTFATFTAPNGKEYQYDTWHPMNEPVVVNGMVMLPTADEAEQFRLQIKLADGRIWSWFGFRDYRSHKLVQGATHWRLPASGFYEI